MQLARVHKGVLLLVIGTILFLYSTGLITRGLSIIIILTSLAMMAYGFYLVDGQKLVHALLQKGKGYQAKRLEKKDDD
jgi:hypothetical protein